MGNLLHTTGTTDGMANITADSVENRAKPGQGLVNVDQELVNVDQELVNVDQGLVNPGQGLVNVDQGLVNADQGLMDSVNAINLTDDLVQVIEKDAPLALPELQSTLNSLKMLLAKSHTPAQDTINISVQLLNDFLNQFNVLAQEYECIKKQSGLDGLTGLVAAGEALGRFIKLYLKGYKLLKENPGKPSLSYAFMMIDADNFRKGNTQKGHYFMDQVLKVLAQIIQQNIRKTDLAMRLGGEEIGILYQVSHKKVASIKGEMIRQLIEQYAFDEQYKQTVSIGLYIFKITQDNTKDLDNIFEQYDNRFRLCYNADQRKEINKQKQQAIVAYLEPIFQAAREGSDDAVYKAKMLGKNRVEMYMPNEDYVNYRQNYSRQKEVTSQH